VALPELAAWLPLVALRALLGGLPPPLSLAFGAAVGRLYVALHGPRTRDALVNLAIALPECPEQERRRVQRESFANLGRGLAEVCLMQGRYRDRVLDGVAIEGLDHLEAARARSASGGALVVTAHFGSWELGAAAVARQGIPVTVVHHGFESARVADMVKAWREEAGLETLELGSSARGILDALKRGRLVAFLMDQNAKPGEGVFAPFFGELACTRSGPVRIAMKQGLPLLPIFFHRAPSGSGHVARFEAPIEMDASALDSDEALRGNVARMNAAIEARVRAAPEHWIWSHRRWKTRPEGDARRLYPSRHRDPSRHRARG
jgi:KDO2-lipid IV(A) lauroyltransferase